MNVGGGEAADQLVRMALSGTEVLVKLSGSALKNLLALTLALARENKKISGKINLGRMLKETRDIRTFAMTPAQYQAFRKMAGKQKILFSAIRDRDDRGKLVDVVLPATELERANFIFERMGYDAAEGPDRSGDPPEQERRRWWQKLFDPFRRKEKNSPETDLTEAGEMEERENGPEENPTGPETGGEEIPDPEPAENTKEKSDTAPMSEMKDPAFPETAVREVKEAPAPEMEIRKTATQEVEIREGVALEAERGAPPAPEVKREAVVIPVPTPRDKLKAAPEKFPEQITP